jgi:hypothetical protein
VIDFADARKELKRYGWRFAHKLSSPFCAVYYEKPDDEKSRLVELSDVDVWFCTPFWDSDADSGHGQWRQHWVELDNIEELIDELKLLRK